MKIYNSVGCAIEGIDEIEVEENKKGCVLMSRKGYLNEFREVD